MKTKIEQKPIKIPVMESVLTEALRVTGDRMDNYGHPLANHLRIAILWNAYLAAKRVTPDGVLPAVTVHSTANELQAHDVAELMILVKTAREMHSSKRDNHVDRAGYVRCVARIKNIEP
jgi:uncharacterized protein DUF6378